VLYQADFKLEGEAKLRPKIRQNVYAQVEGLIKKVNVKHDDLVHKGDILLVQESPDLDKQLEEVRGQLQKDYAQLDATRRELDRNEELTEADKSKRKAKPRSFRKSIKSFNKQLAPLNARKRCSYQKPDRRPSRHVQRGRTLGVEPPGESRRESARNCRPRQRVGA